MSTPRAPILGLIFATVAALAAVRLVDADESRLKPPAGLHSHTPTAHALVGARIVVKPGEVIERGNLIIRDGMIVAVGADAAVPADARVWPMSGKTISPGWINLGSELASDAATITASYWNSQIVPEFRAAPAYRPDHSTNARFRTQGIVARLVAPTARIVKGSSVLVSTGDDDARAIIAADVALHLKLTVARGGSVESYPSSPMGALTLVRQALYDAQWYAKALNAYERPGVPRPETIAALEALRPYVEGRRTVVIDAADVLYFFRASRLADEFKLDAIIRGSGEEYQRLDDVKRAGRPVLVPIDFPKAPNVRTPEAALAISLERLMHWDLAPENPGRLDAAGVTIALSSHGMKSIDAFLKSVRQAVDHGLKPDAALKALTTTPAKLAGVESRLGTLEAGKLASLLVSDGDLFDSKTKILETWIEGTRYESTTAGPIDPRGTWELQIKRPDGGSETLTCTLTGAVDKLTGSTKRGDSTLALKNALFEGGQLTFHVDGKALGGTGILQASLTLFAEPKPQAAAPQESSTLLRGEGSLTWADGATTALTARQTEAHRPSADDKSAKPGDGKPADKPAQDDDDGKQDAAEKKPADEKKPTEEAKRPKRALYPVNYPLGEFGVDAAPGSKPAKGVTVLFRNATVWTCGPDGTLANTDVLIQNGRIAAVGKRLEAPEKAEIVDLRGKHLSPGVIDCHSHIATDGGVNETGQTNTAEVRIGDFIDNADINIYRQLAGGVTTANILHGSANTIGGQNQVLKFRWGASAEEMKFAEAPPGIKFALGENVKQSNWPSASHRRYPQSRMGVDQVLRDAFKEAREYRRRQREYKPDGAALPPRVDLELEALAEVLEGKRLVHCHSYRQDEILVLLKACDEFGVRVATLQHVLEGYKVADAIARHGAGGSSFSDWWAYKFEVYDAIPQNGAIMHKAGVVVSFNSDDAEMARRLNQEAAKATKYGGVPADEAIKFVTLNAARQLGIDNHVGSIEVGKQADLAVWSGTPLSAMSRCEQTWIDGKKYFDLRDDLARRATVAERRAALIQRVLNSGETLADPDEGRKDLWPREDLFCDHDDEHDHAR